MTELPDIIAIIADIHGNADALRAVLADIDAQGGGLIVNLGDHLSGPMAARETLALLRARPEMIHIRGDHDRSLIERRPEEMGPSDRAAYDQLTGADLDWLRALAPTRILGDELFLCHATPQDDLTYWLEKVGPDGAVSLRPHGEVYRLAQSVDQGVILCGHTHIPRAVRLTDGRLIVNPGSVGLPAYDDDAPVPHVMRSGTPDACYAILERAGAGWRPVFRHVPYDSRRMAAMARAAGRRDWAQALATGWL